MAIKLADTIITDARLLAFARYVKVQRSGRFNMLDPRARQAASLTEEEHVFILDNYEALEQAATGKAIEADFMKGAGK